MSTLILVPTELELRHLRAGGGLAQASARIELTGFGPVAAAARTAQLLAQLAPERCLLVGIAGSFDPERAPLGTAYTFRRVALDGVGAGAGQGLQSPSQLGFPQWPGSRDTTAAIAEELPLVPVGSAPGALLLTACAASDGPELALLRRQRYPEAVAEDMEGFGVALACALARVPLAVVRGISNVVGDRDVERWRIREALGAARDLTLEALARGDWKEARETA